MSKKVKIVLTGGGTAGHVMPHIAMLENYESLGWEVVYIGSKGMERDLMKPFNLCYFTIPVGKLRRYFSFQNFLDLFRFFAGIVAAFFILIRVRPKLVFSKGGFVSVPVALSAWILRIPVFSHESDLTPGLANKIIYPFARKVFYCFPDTAKYVDSSKSKLVGLPIRRELLQGDAELGHQRCFPGQKKDKPTILVMGGSLGAQRINELLELSLDSLVKKFFVIHITGRGKGISFKDNSYKSFEFISDGLSDIFSTSDLVVSRSGANSLFEFLALDLPMILIPLELGSRGDQVHNANCLRELGLAKIIRETDLNKRSLEFAIEEVLSKGDRKAHGADIIPKNSAELIISEFKSCLSFH